ncbi:MAG: hypothetical protein K0U12_02030 [Gammaproteobacteria bacterium]|nr:hypothetical protein [Gammaproteobacteria bacterium]
MKKNYQSALAIFSSPEYMASQLDFLLKEDPSGKAPLEYIKEKGVKQVINTDLMKVVRFSINKISLINLDILLKRGVDLYVVFRGYSAIHSAILRGQLGLLWCLRDWFEDPRFLTAKDEASEDKTPKELVDSLNRCYLLRGEMPRFKRLQVIHTGYKACQSIIQDRDQPDLLRAQALQCAGDIVDHFIHQPEENPLYQNFYLPDIREFYAMALATYQLVQWDQVAKLDEARTIIDYTEDLLRQVKKLDYSDEEKKRIAEHCEKLDVQLHRIADQPNDKEASGWWDISSIWRQSPKKLACDQNPLLPKSNGEAKHFSDSKDTDAIAMAEHRYSYFPSMLISLDNKMAQLVPQKTERDAHSAMPLGLRQRRTESTSASSSTSVSEEAEYSDTDSQDNTNSARLS